MFLVSSWPQAILHLDADAFFASVIQAVNPSLKEKAVVVGKERGIVTACSYQAKTMGIERGMRIIEVKKQFPSAIIVDSDYELYQIFSWRMFDLIRQFSPLVEEYSIDEAFVDLKGLRRPLNMSYEKIALTIKKTIEAKLGITVSVGVSVTKSLAKLASSFQKPSGLTIIDGLSIEKFLEKIDIEKVWGIGDNTASYLKKLGIKTALDFVQKDEFFIKKYLTKPFFEIWQELKGIKVYEINSNPKESFKSITRSQTFYPPSNYFETVLAKLITHCEEAFYWARKFGYRVGEITIFLKTNDFHIKNYHWFIKPAISYPFVIHDEIKENLRKIFDKNESYRTVGCTLSRLEKISDYQDSLFSLLEKEEKVKKVYPLIEQKKVDFGTILYDVLSTKERKKKKFLLPMIKI